jgi:hypothetical protein
MLEKQATGVGTDCSAGIQWCSSSATSFHLPLGSIDLFRFSVPIFTRKASLTMS